MLTKAVRTQTQKETESEREKAEATKPDIKNVTVL